jgi:SAM-dependent methyltransferase
MKRTTGINLDTVKEVYNGPEGDLWELVMGEQIHIGGFASSMDLAEKARIPAGATGVDLCCCNGAGMRFLKLFRKVGAMTGVDATETVVERGNERGKEVGITDATFVLADACDSGLPDASFDFVWGEDAWCYVEDKKALVAEAARIVKLGGTIAFTDWIEGENEMTEEEAERFLTFMKFPNINNLDDYNVSLEANGCDVLRSSNTGRFPVYMDLYLDMLTKQLTYDALKIIGFNAEMMEAMGGEMAFMRELAHAGKIAQALFIAKKIR